MVTDSTNRLKALFLVVFLLGGPLAALAQNALIRGRVVLADRQPASHVSVGLRGTAIGTDTDANGNYQLSSVAPGSYVLAVRLIGYAGQERRIEVTAGQTLELDFTLAATRQDLDEVTVTSSNRYRRPNPSQSLRLGEPLLEAPQNVQVVTSQLLADQQIFNATEGIARNVSGVVAPGHWNNVYARLTIRGFNTGFGSLRNGMSVSNYFGPLLEDLSFVERVEFVKGPGGFLLSNSEAGGFYNVVTKTPTGSGRKSASLTLGSFGTYRASTDLDGRLSRDGKLQYRLNLMGQSLDSYQGSEFNRKTALAPSLRYQLDDKTTLTAQYAYQYANFSAAGNYVFSPNGYKSVSQDFSVYDPVMGSSRVNDHSAFTTVEHRFSDNWKVTGQLAYLRYAMRGISTWFGAGSFNPAASFSLGGQTVDGANVLNRTLFVYDVDNFSFLGQAYLNGTVTTGPVQHRVIVGLDASDKTYAADFGAAGAAPQSIVNPTYYSAPPSTLANVEDIRSAQDLDRRGLYKGFTKYAGVYVQDELGFFDNILRLTLAARYSNNNNVRARIKDDVITPRFGLSATVLPNTALYALYDQSFIPQTGTDRNGNFFDPQRARNIEVGVKRDWQEGRFSSTLTAFNITKKNLLTADPVDARFSVQTGEVRSRGLEADFTGELVPGLNLVANYSYIDPEVTKDNVEANVGKKLAGAAKHNANAWLNYRLQRGTVRGLGFSGGVQWQVDRYAGLGGLAVVLPDNYFRVDGGISWQNERVNLNLLVNNLTGRYNYVGAGYGAGYGTGATAVGNTYYWQPEAPTSYRLSVGYNF